MRKNSHRFARMLCAVSASAAAGQVLANSGIQLPLSQYQAGQEQTTPVTNGGFEADGVGNLPTPTGWMRSGTEMFVDPVYSAPPLNPAAVGSFSAQTRGSGANSYDQGLGTLAAGKNYVLSAYVWNSGNPDPTGGGNGDLAEVKVVDPNNSLSNIAMILEGTGTNGQSGSTGRFMYLLFNQADVAAWSGVNVQVISETGTVVGTLPNPWAQYDNIAVTPAENFVAQKWLFNVSGNWTDDGKWLGGVNPNAQASMFFSTSKGAIASFTDGITSNQTISVNAARTVAVMNFDNASASYTIAGSSTISMDVTADGFGNTQGVPEIAVLSGSHTISAPILLLRNAILDVAPSNGSLTISGNFNANGRIITKRGSGMATLNNLRSIGLNLEGGTLRIAPNSMATGVSRITNVSIAAGGRFDLTDNKLITQTAVGSWNGSAYDGVTGMIQSGRNGGGWGGSGIVTSQTSATNGNFTSIGVATAAQAKLIASTATATWAGQTVTGTDTLVMYTYGGDANLDGKINVDDYGRIDSNIGLGTAGWYNGDFNYDGKVNVDDYGIIDSNVGIQGAPFFAAGTSNGGAGVQAVPEPAALAAAGAVFLALRRRKRAENDRFF
jgi:hypothetical protein